MKSAYLFLILFFVVSASHVWAQGCSDAGFCSIGGMQPAHSFSNPDTTYAVQNDSSALPVKTYANSVSVICTFGEGDDQTHIITPALQYAHVFNAKLEIQTKISGSMANGNLGRASGLGDLFLSGTYTLNPDKKWKWLGTAGIKIPLNQSDLSNSSTGSLPMTYQSSLGTVDALVGVSLAHQNFRFAVGYQQPLTRQNQNQYLQEDLEGTVYEPYASAYPNTRLFHRKADLLCRATYITPSIRNFKFMLGGLGIYHISNDTYTAKGTEEEIEIEHSAGLTLNLTGSIAYTPQPWLNISLLAGKPVVVREVRPDGLTRHWVVIPEITFAF